MHDDIAIKVREINKAFKLPHEKSNTLKSLFVNVFRGRRTYEHQQVLKDISFDVKKGEFFGIVGRNGSGKSTMLKLLAGIYTPDTGSIDIQGSLTPFIELGVGFNPELTGRENVFLNGALLGFNRKQMESMYGEIVAFAELEKFMDQKLKNYSSGMQVRLAFSIAIQANTDILILDEVLAVGDASFQKKCFDYFIQLKEEGKTVILVSHDMGSVKRFCTKAIYIKDGDLIHFGTPADVAEIYADENITENKNATAKNDGLSHTHKVRAQITQKEKGRLELEVDYSSKNPEDKMYIGISISKDGISIAEITTSLEKFLQNAGRVTYELDTTMFNEGVYKIGTGLFRLKNRELLAVSKDRNVFSVRDRDITKGAALRLPDTWQYKQKEQSL